MLEGSRRSALARHSCQHAFEHGRGVDRREAVADHGFRFVQASLFVANLGDQAGREPSGGRLRADIFLSALQRFEELTLGQAEAELLELDQALKTEAIHM